MTSRPGGPTKRAGAGVPVRAAVVAAASVNVTPMRGWARRTLFRPGVLFLLTLVTAGLVLTPYVSRWLPKLGELPEYRVRVAEMRIPPPHRWAPADIVSQVIVSNELP